MKNNCMVYWSTDTWSNYLQFT